MSRFAAERVREIAHRSEYSLGPVSGHEAHCLATEVLELRAALRDVAEALPAEQCQCHTAGCALDHQVRVARRAAVRELAEPEHLPGVVYQDAS